MTRRLALGCAAAAAVLVATVGCKKSAGGGGVAGGRVAIDRLVTGSASQYIATAAFPFAAADDCAGVPLQAGSCCFIAQPKPVSNEPQRDAGPITLDDVTSGQNLGAIAFSGPPSNVYFDTQWTTPDWTANDAIKASSPGASYPAFSVTVPAPADIGGLTPAWTKTTALTISRSSDLALAWTPDAGTGARVVRLRMGFEQNVAGFPFDGLVSCTVPDAAGSLVVSSSLLASLHAGDLCYGCDLARASSGSATDVTFVLTTHSGGPTVVQ